MLYTKNFSNFLRSHGALYNLTTPCQLSRNAAWCGRGFRIRPLFDMLINAYCHKRKWTWSFLTPAGSTFCLPWQEKIQNILYGFFFCFDLFIMNLVYYFSYFIFLNLKNYLLFPQYVQKMFSFKIDKKSSKMSSFNIILSGICLKLLSSTEWYSKPSQGCRNWSLHCDSHTFFRLCSVTLSFVSSNFCHHSAD